MSAVTPTIKVTHIASGDLWAGAEVQLFTLAKALHQSNEASVNVILLNHGELEKRLREQGILVDVIPENKLNGLQIFIQLKTLLKQKQPDVVHTHRIKENILGGLAARFTGNIPSIRTAHGAPEHQRGWRKPHKQLLYTLDRLVGLFIQQKIIAVSDDLAAILKKEFPAEKINVIANGVDIDALSPYAKSRYKRKLLTNSIKIGLIGRLVPVKRVDIFIETAKYLRGHYPEIKAIFHIYGDGPLRDKLESLAASLDINDILQFEGHVSEIHSVMVELDLLLITSHHEGLPMTLLEAMVLNIPIIAHATGGIPQVLADYNCAYLVTQNTPRKYAEAIIKSVNNHTQWKNCANPHSLEKYSAANNGKCYLAQYQSIAFRTGGA